MPANGPAFAVLGLFDSARCPHATRSPRSGRGASARLRPTRPTRSTASTRPWVCGVRRWAAWSWSWASWGPIAALGFQCWIERRRLPHRHGRQGPFSWQAFVPDHVRSDGASSPPSPPGLGMLLLLEQAALLRPPDPPDRKAIAAITRDRFALAVEAEARPATRRRPRGALPRRAPPRSRWCRARTAGPSSPAISSCGRWWASSSPAWWRASPSTGPSSSSPSSRPWSTCRSSPA